MTPLTQRPVVLFTPPSSVWKTVIEVWAPKLRHPKNLLYYFLHLFSSENFVAPKNRPRKRVFGKFGKCFTKKSKNRQGQGVYF